MNFRAVLASAVLASGCAHGAVTLFQPETFDLATFWQSGSPNSTPPSVIPNGGPMGTGDSFLQITSDVGGGAGSRLIAFNSSSDWTGNYTAAGVSGLTMDLRNGGQGSLFVRVAVNGPGGWFVTDAREVAAGRGFENFSFDLEAGALTPARVNSPTLGTDAGATLAGVTQLRILHNPDHGDARGAVATAALRVDNITAVPEPGLGALIAVSFGMFAFRKR